MAIETGRLVPESGLSPDEARRRLARFGPNELPESPREPLWSRLLRQVREPMSLLLIAAAAVTAGGLRKRADAIAILAIVVANIVIALIQEGKAARALEALRAMEAPVAVVERGGRAVRIPAREIVPGDLIVLGAGDRIPADARLQKVASVEVDESILTGESLPVPKDAGDRAFAGTLMVRGSARGVVEETGSRTQLGAIAERLSEPEPATPLQVELRKLTARLGLVAIVIAVAVFGLTLLRAGVWQTSFLAAAALAVAAVPEGLPTVVTVALALGVRRMASRGAIVRRLPAVETLGATTVILTDKTGTLTENRMRVSSVFPSEGAGLAADLMVLCNDATLAPRTGDPMEIAMVEAAGEEHAAELRTRFPRSAELPFDSERKRMTTLHRNGEEFLVLMKGAPEEVLARCELDVRQHRDLLEKSAELAGQGARVLACARKDLSVHPEDLEEAENDLRFVALVALRDPVRAEAPDVVRDARAAGIDIVMVTGDHSGTAAFVAREVGIEQVHARVTPDEKLRLVTELQRKGEIVAVTGDGVNDAPALRRADIGVAMGRAGSDVAREAADMVVTDDNLATVVYAIREGRGIYDNIRKVVDYLVAGNLSEILVVISGLAMFPSLGVPLLPLQLLWVNLLTDGFPALALAVDPVDPGLLRRPPRGRADRLLSVGTLRLLSSRAILIAMGAVGALTIERYVWDEPWAHARAVMFTVLVTAHLLMAFVARRPRGSPGAKLAPNRWLFAAVGGGLVLQFVVVTWARVTSLFGTAPLIAREWGLIAAAGVLPVLAMALRRKAAP